MSRLAHFLATTLRLAVGSLLKSAAPSMPPHLVQPDDDFTEADYHAVVCEVVELMAKDRREEVGDADLIAWEMEYRLRESAE